MSVSHVVIHLRVRVSLVEVLGARLFVTPF